MLSKASLKNSISMLGFKLIHVSKSGPWSISYKILTIWFLLVKATYEKYFDSNRENIYWQGKPFGHVFQVGHKGHGFVTTRQFHYDDVIMGAIASLITSLTIVYSTVYLDADQRKHQSSASLAFVWGIHRGPVNSPHKWPVTWKIFSFDDVIMFYKIDTSLFAGKE